MLKFGMLDSRRFHAIYLGSWALNYRRATAIGSESQGSRVPTGISCLNLVCKLSIDSTYSLFGFLGCNSLWSICNQFRIPGNWSVIPIFGIFIFFYKYRVLCLRLVLNFAHLSPH